MSGSLDQAGELAGLLLREGALNREDPEHKRVYAELMGDELLFRAVRERLAVVGYELVQELGHLGVRVAAAAEQAEAIRNKLGIHAGHIRLIVYLWTHLVYREWKNLRWGDDSAAPGPDQALIFDDPEAEDVAWMSLKKLEADFADQLSKSALSGFLNQLRRWRFIRLDRRRDRVEADASLYIQVDRHRMEAFVVGLARRLGCDAPVDAVTEIAAGSRPATEPSSVEAPS
jgi:hypothetical protein